jgi:hypothetical protein
MMKIINALRALFTRPAPPTLAQRLIAVHITATNPRKTLG